MKKNYRILIPVLLIVFFLFGSFNIAKAQISSPSAVRQQALSAREQTLKDKALQEINRRIASLNDLVLRIQAMKKLSDTNKVALNAEAQAEIQNLNSLSAKISADTTLAEITEDRKSIFIEYRIYLLFIPRIQILAAADRIIEFADSASELVVKFQSRIVQDQQSGKDTTEIQAALTDLMAKLTDARLQAKAAQDLVLPLKPDMGNTATAAANKQALQSARAKLVIARKDIAAALHDAASIITGLKSPVTLRTSTSSATRSAVPFGR